MTATLTHEAPRRVEMTTRRPTPDPLVDLVQRTAVGHERAFDELYATTRARVYSQVNRVVQNASLAAEVTQDVYIDLWRHACRYDQALGSVMAWMLTIARRRAIDRVRHEERRRKLDARYCDVNPPVDVDVFAIVDKTMLAEHVRLALRELTDRQRQAVELAYLDGYANLEIAELLGIPLGTTKTRIRDGLLRLQATLTEESWLTPIGPAYRPANTRVRTPSSR